MRSLLLIFVTLFFISCDDQITNNEKPDTRIVTPVCPTSPYPEPPQVSFDGLSSVENVGETSSKLNWREHPDAQAYLVFLAEEGQSFKVVKTVSSPASSTFLTGLTPETSYRARVSMINDSGVYDFNSSIKSFTTQTRPIFRNTTALRFQGSSNVALQNSNHYFPRNRFTISMWFKGDPTNSYEEEERLLTFHKGFDAGTAFSLGVIGEKVFVKYRAQGSNNSKMESYKVNFNDGQWHHVALTYNEHYLVFYVDGNRAKEKKVELQTPGEHRASIGSYTGLQMSFSGLIDEVSFWDDALGGDTIRAIKDLASGADLMVHQNANRLVSWYRMGDVKQDTIGQITDLVSSRNGTPSNIKIDDFIQDTP